ncbi:MULTISPECIES: hypothetical protein [unclassified Wolbachia]|uniref:hypothetical protein n=1 Tax=unclassified Wolbachia TaxID=2640676 RepID=UPI0021F8B0A1|nr:hypothetical protein [Wolbachia endosymbiont (group A) of Cydia splendana]
MRYLLSEERCNKAIPVSSTGMTRKGALEFLFQYCTLAMHLNRYELSAFFG